jgi:hypothetical protein
MSNKSNFAKNINYAINCFLNICVNRSSSKKSTFVMILIIFVSNSFFDKVQLKAHSKIKNVVITSSKCVLSAKRNITRRANIASNSISNEIAINSTKNEMIKTTNANEKMITTTTKNSIRKSMTKKKTQDLHRHQFRDSDDHERYVSSRHVLSSEHDLLSTQRTK